MGREIQAKHNIEPRLSLRVIRCEKKVVPGSSNVALCVIELHALTSSVVVPVSESNPMSPLRQEVNTDWDRRISTTDESDSPSFVNPVVVSPRSRWFLDGDTVEIYDRATLIDGANRLEGALQHEMPHEVPVLIVMGLENSSELTLRSQLQEANTRSNYIRKERVGTTSPRLIVHDVKITLKMVSDPFVVPTFRGYSPAVLVQRLNVPHLEHLLIGAKSLATELEQIRVTHGSLVGLHVSIKKPSSERTSPYEVQLNEPPSRFNS